MKFTLLLFLCLSAHTQEVTYKTNRITSVESFRRVGGQLYNTEKSYLFGWYEGKVVSPFTNGFIFQQIEKKAIYETVRPQPDRWARIGAFATGTSYTPFEKKVGEEEVVGEKYFVINYPWQKYPTTGSPHGFRAKQSGTIQIGEETLKVIDYGTPNIVEVVTAITNAPSESANKTANSGK